MEIGTQRVWEKGHCKEIHVIVMGTNRNSVVLVTTGLKGHFPLVFHLASTDFFANNLSWLLLSLNVQLGFLAGVSRRRPRSELTESRSCFCTPRIVQGCSSSSSRRDH